MAPGVFIMLYLKASVEHWASDRYPTTGRHKSPSRVRPKPENYWAIPPAESKKGMITMHEEPTWTKVCTRGTPVSRWHGQRDVSCSRCGTEHNTFGQRLRSGWRANPSTWDDNINDLEGFELAHANDH